MDSKLGNKNKFIKITFLEIFPPINEIIKSKEDLNIVFQGNDNFYDLKKFLSLKNTIQLNYNKKSLIMTLLKNNNIFATGFFTIRQGEQNIFFNYENNKENISNKTVKINNISGIIKIKIFCECDNSSKNSTININNRNTINANYDNISNNKYITKVNLMKPIRINNYKNKINNKNIYDKKKTLLNHIHHANNNTMKKNLVNNSQEFLADYTTFLTEEKNLNNNFINNDIKKLSKIISNTARKNESSNDKNININHNRIIKAKSKNFFSTNKKQNKNIKINNSSLNLINQNNKNISNENCQNNNITNNRNYFTNRNSLKSNTSFNNKVIKRISNTHYLINKEIKTNLNNYVSGQIIEHVNGKEKLNYISINKITNNKNITKKENKKVKSNNITMNSISTNFTKKNDLEFSSNSLQDYEEKNFLNFNLSNKNTLRPFTNRVNVNEKLIQKLSGNKNNLNDNINRNYTKHKFNKSLCQQSFTEKIFCQNNDLKLNLYQKNKNLEYNLCKSENKLVVNLNEVNNDINNTNDFKNEEENEIENDLENDNYTKLKEDFNLLYNLDYIKKINEDLLKLEAELFIEKMSELFSEYHTQMDEKILDKKIIDREYKINFRKYLLYCKLSDKLNFFNKKYNKEKEKEINMSINKQNIQNVDSNINEFDIFKIIFPDLLGEDNKEKKNKLKNILSIILNKEENQELIKEKYDKLDTFL